jgi:nucleoside-diphosphate-sugar epimerase
MTNGKVLIIGGTGFLGYYAVRELLKRDYAVSILALPPLPAKGLFPAEVEIVLADLNKLTDEEVKERLAGHDAVIFAAGADDRATPKAPAYPFFYKYNVEATRRLATLAKGAGVKRMVVLGSYFAYFDRAWPELKLKEHHPYIRSRVEQEEILFEVAGKEMDAMVLELPYIFGSMPGRKPIWTPLLNYIASTPVIFYTHGGTNCIAVEHIGEAIAGAVEFGKGGERYVIGDENLTWKELLEKLSELQGKRKSVVTLPNWSATLAGAVLKLMQHLQGKESGLDPIQLIRLQTAMTFFDPEPARTTLHFGQGGLDVALQKTIEAAR